MRWNLNKTMIAAAALSLPYLCSAATMGTYQPMDPQVEQDCTNGLNAPADVHFGRNARLTATPMFDITGDQRLDLFVTVRDDGGAIVRQTVCSYDMNQNLVSAHTPWPDEMTQWIWE